MAPQKNTKEKEGDPILMYLQETVKLSVLFCTIVGIFAGLKWLLEITGSGGKLVFVEKIFDITKNVGFLLLIVERSLHILSVLWDKSDGHITNIYITIAKRIAAIRNGCERSKKDRNKRFNA